MSDVNSFKQLIRAIIKGQESIIGPLAWSEAGKVSGITVTDGEVSLSGDGKTIISSLVAQYKTLFGQASVEACKDAVRPLLPKMKDVDIPKSLL